MNDETQPIQDEVKSQRTERLVGVFIIAAVLLLVVG